MSSSVNDQNNNTKSRFSLGDDTESLAGYRRYLFLAWCLWLAWRLFVMPWVMWWLTDVGQFGIFVLWQGLLLLPMLILTPVIKRAKNAYALIVISLILMVYWAISASHLLNAVYQGQTLLVMVYGLENVLLAMIFITLFLLTKKMPAMHKNS